MERKIAVLLSGSGRTLENILEKLPDIEVAVVISSKKDVRGIEIALEHNIPTYVVERRLYADSSEFSERINEIIFKYSPELIVLAGFLSFYDYPEQFEGKVLNIHPALIPAFSGKGFYGMRVHKAVYEKGVKVTGCTVHFVDKRYDNGAIIAQKVCFVDENDTPESIAGKVFELEKELYPEVIKAYFENKILIKDERAFIVK